MIRNSKYLRWAGGLAACLALVAVSKPATAQTAYDLDLCYNAIITPSGMNEARWERRPEFSRDVATAVQKRFTPQSCADLLMRNSQAPGPYNWNGSNGVLTLGKPNSDDLLLQISRADNSKFDIFLALDRRKNSFAVISSNQPGNEFILRDKPDRIGMSGFDVTVGKAELILFLNMLKNSTVTVTGPAHSYVISSTNPASEQASKLAAIAEFKRENNLE